MATCFAPLTISGGSSIKKCQLLPSNTTSFGKVPKVMTQKKSNNLQSDRKLSVCAEYSDESRGGSGEFFAGFLIGGVVFGTAAYILAPRIRRSILNEDEYGFRKAKRPQYYDGGLEKTRQTLNSKINQLNSTIDNVSSRLRGTKNTPKVALVDIDSELEATI